MTTKKKSLARRVTCPTERLIRSSGHHFFGYYNKSPWDASDRYVLANRYSAMDAALDPGRRLDVGYVDTLSSSQFRKFGETTAWNWQMGCQLQWLGRNGRRVIYNTRSSTPRGVYPHYAAVIHDIDSGETRHLPDPIYSVAPDGRFALTVDYDRLFVTHETIGYAPATSALDLEKCPENDGLRVIDIASGESSMIVSYADLRAFRSVPSMDRATHWISHIEVNPTSNRIVFLHRWTERFADETCFLHRLITVDPSGRGMRLLECSDHPLPQLERPFDPAAVGTFDYEKDAHQISHPLWADDAHVIVWGPHAGGTHYHLYHDADGGKVSVIGGDVLNENGHMSFSPANPRWMLTDTYPDDERSMRSLMLYDLEEEALIEIGEFYTPDLRKVSRCDLHPRWNHAGDKVCIDSVHEGERQMYLVDVSCVVGRK